MATDESGKVTIGDIDAFLRLGRRIVGSSMEVLGGFCLMFAAAGAQISQPETILQGAQLAALGCALIALGSTIFSHNETEQFLTWGLEAAFAALNKSSLMQTINTIVANAAVGNESTAREAVTGVANRALMITAFLLAIDLEEVCTGR